MNRRFLPLVAALGLGFLALGTGLFVLHRTFRAERATALAESAGRRVALEQYARATLAQNLGLRVQAEASRLAAAAADPLVPASDLLLWEGGRQVLPRRSDPRPGTDTPAATLFERLASDTVVTTDEEGPWAERLELRHDLLDALQRDDPLAVEKTFRSILLAQSRYVLEADRDVPYMLAIIDHFIRKGRPDARLLRLLLHDGVPDGKGSLVESVQRRLLHRREAFSAADFNFLVGKVLALGTPAGVPADDFRARVADRGPEVPAEVDGPALLPGGWYAVPDAGGARGFHQPEAPLLQGLTQEMQARGLLAPREHVVSAGPLVGPVHGLSLQIASPGWAEAEQQADAAFWQKTLLLGLCALLALAIVVLALLGQLRKQRYLALKSDFVSTVSHELRTPLASIRVMAETLERRLAGEAKARDYPGRIVGAVDGLALMVENILSFNRLDRGRWVARKTPTRLVDLLQRAHDKVVPHASKPLQWHQAGDLQPLLLVDAELVELLLVNLARNALQYCDRPEASVTFTVVPSPGLHLEVADNGRGMSPEVVRHVFTPFYRAPESAGSRGSGLGLALCQRIVELHKGRIRVKTSGPEGTVFTLVFPPEVLS